MVFPLVNFKCLSNSFAAARCHTSELLRHVSRGAQSSQAQDPHALGLVRMISLAARDLARLNVHVILLTIIILLCLLRTDLITKTK